MFASSRGSGSGADDAARSPFTSVIAALCMATSFRFPLRCQWACAREERRSHRRQHGDDMAFVLQRFTT